MPTMPVSLPVSPPFLLEEPKWLLDSNRLSEIALTKNEDAQQRLNEVKKASVEECYSSEALHKEVGKLVDFEQALAGLVEEKSHIEKLLIDQKNLFAKQSLEFKVKQEKIESLKSNLITSLLQWKEKAEKINQENEKIEQDFQAINRKIESNKKKYDVKLILNEYALFLSQHAGRVSIVEQKANYYKINRFFTPSMPLCGIIAVTDRNDLLTKTPAQLKEAADLTSDTALMEQANSLLAEWNSYSDSLEQFKAGMPSDWARLDENGHSKRHQAAIELATEHVNAASKLEEVSKGFFHKLHEEQKQLFLKIHMLSDENGKLNVARKKFIEAELESASDNKDVEKQLHMVQCYDALQSLAQQTAADYDRFRSESIEFEKKYQTANEMYGVYRREEADLYSFTMIGSIGLLGQTIDVAEKYLEKKKKNVEGYRHLLLKAELKQLLRIALNNVGFWTHQIAYFSNQKIKTTPVPQGIAMLYQDLRMADDNKFSTEDMVAAFQTTVSRRKAAGTGYIFKRTMNTTDEFYTLIQSLSVKDLDKLTFARFKEKLCHIQDSEGRKLIPHVPACSREVTAISSFENRSTLKSK